MLSRRSGPASSPLEGDGPPHDKPTRASPPRTAPTSPPAINVSVEIPNWLAFRFRRAIRNNDLSQAFPLLRVSLKSLHPLESATGAAGQFSLNIENAPFPGRKWRPKSKIEDSETPAVADEQAPAPTPAQVQAQVATVQLLLFELLNEPNYRVVSSMTHTLCSHPSDVLQWQKVPDSIGSIAVELDVVRPLFCLTRAPQGAKATLTDGSDTTPLDNNQLDDLSLASGPLGHGQRYVPPFATLDKECDNIAGRIGSAFVELKDAYLDPSACRFRLTGSLGFHVYGVEHIRGRLQRALYSVTTPSESESESESEHESLNSRTTFQAIDLVRELESNWIKSTICEAFPTSFTDPAIRAIRAAGYTTTTHTTTKFSIQFELDTVFVAAHFARIGVPYVKSILFPSEFKVSFIYDASSDAFKVSPRGLRYRVADRTIRHTWVTMLTPSPDVGILPVMPRVRFGVAHAACKSETWALANGFVGMLEQYAQENKDAVLKSTDLTPFPEAFRQAVSKVRMEFAESTALAKPGRDEASRRVSVKLITRFDVQGKGMAVVAHPTYLYFELRHVAMAQALESIEDEEEQKRAVGRWAKELAAETHRVAAELRDVIHIKGDEE